MSDTNPPNTGEGGSDNSNSGGSSTSNNNNRSNRNNNRFRNVGNHATRTFEGAEPKVGAVLGLRSERFDKKVTFEVFKEKMINYIGREMEMGDDIVCIIKTGADPQDKFDKKYPKSNFPYQKLPITTYN